MVTFADRLTFVPIATVTQPRDGFCEIYMNRWWVYYPDKGLAIYQGSPQCNKNETIARLIQQSYYPDAELILLELVYLSHDCHKYMWTDSDY